MSHTTTSSKRSQAISPRDLVDDEPRVEPDFDDESFVSGLAELHAFVSVPTATDLHRVIVLHPSVRRSADTIVPMMLLKQHHGTEPEMTVQTAVLLLTDRRWSLATGALIRKIEESGLLDDDLLDSLARAFLGADGDAIYWTVPDEWFDHGHEIVLDGADDPGGSDSHEEETGRDDEPIAPVLVRRELSPSLRRWAAERVVRQKPRSWYALTKRAQEVSSRHGAAIEEGLLDAVEAFPAEMQGVIVQWAIEATNGSVRFHGLRLMAERGDVAGAIERAQRDPNRKVRAWADQQRRRAGAAAESAAKLAAAPVVEQDALF
jgi:hypothetical protein